MKSHGYEIPQVFTSNETMFSIDPPYLAPVGGGGDTTRYVMSTVNCKNC